MATLLLSAAGAAVGAGFGGTVLGLSGAVVGRAVGATLGRAIDQKILGTGSQAVEVGKLDRFRLMGASEGKMIPLVWGRTRVAGQVIWATQFQETATTSGSGKGVPKPRTTQYSYTVSLAIALCEGVITRVGRIWADGIEIEKDQLNLRVYRGAEDQLADPKISAVEGSENAPAYRGTAYVVIEDLDLSRFGNRVPQFNFEVMRRAKSKEENIVDMPDSIRAVALIPGTGEYSLATTRVHYAEGPGENRSANINSASGKTDFTTSLEQLEEELPNCNAVSLVVSWFGNDLRCNLCEIRPKVEQKEFDGVGMPWRAGGINRKQATEVPKIDGRSIYGGTPSDQSVIEAIKAANAAGKQVMFYPFILMDQIQGNELVDPWTGETGQPELPWRGRITTSKAPGAVGTPDRTALAANEVGAFMGNAQPMHFLELNGEVSYFGPDAWRYRRFILHYAKICAIAGGVEAFCIGSEMVAATTIRAESDTFPMVDALIQLAADVREILGQTVKISYAADWTEYSSTNIDGNTYFHLDALWSNQNIDFIGIDNYLPMSDWRDGLINADSDWETIYNVEYLKANINGGEYFDWFYESEEGRYNQVRLSISDIASDEPWVFRKKDILSWWRNYHHARINAVRQEVPSSWLPESKPIRFTEFGCAAVNKATNQPNAFFDPRSSEAKLPVYSTGERDDLIQQQYYIAFFEFWSNIENNPNSTVSSMKMIDLEKCYAWAWDTRPFPAFPAAAELWSDAKNYNLGHWLNGRVTSQSLTELVREICNRVGIDEKIDVNLKRVIRGYSVNEISSARSALQPLELAFSFDTTDRNGILTFNHRSENFIHEISYADFAVESDRFGKPEFSRTGEPDLQGTIQIRYVNDSDSYQVWSAEALYPNDTSLVISQSETNIVMVSSDAQLVSERWLAESRVARDTVQFYLPMSFSWLVCGEILKFQDSTFRIDRISRNLITRVDAVRIDMSHYQSIGLTEQIVVPRPFEPPVPVSFAFLDLPLLQDGDVPHAPYIFATSRPWQGEIGVWRSSDGDGFSFNSVVSLPSIIGTTVSDLVQSRPGVWDDGDALLVDVHGDLPFQSISEPALFLGGNTIVICDSSFERLEVFQFGKVEILDSGLFSISHRLRGQIGSDSQMPMLWPAGSRIFKIQNDTRQLNMLESERGLAFNYRIGVLARGPQDDSAIPLTVAFSGNGLRPYAVSHLKAVRGEMGSIAVSWIRRTRRGGDSWLSLEVPLSEEFEQYQIEVLKDGILRRTEVSTFSSWVYTMAQQVSDAVVVPFMIRVSQISQAYGAGPGRVCTVTD